VVPEPRPSAQAGSRVEREESWASHRGLSILVSVTAFLLPVLVAITAAALLVHLVPKPRSGRELWIWWVLAIVSPWVVYLVANRVAPTRTPSRRTVQDDLGIP
jgi:hypothetical protein